MLGGSVILAKIRIETTLCTKCGNCAQVCPWNIFVQSKPESIPEILHEELCISCGHCVAICSEGAIHHVNISPELIRPILNTIPSSEQMLELMRTRRSIRSFLNKPVEEHLIETIIKAASFAPSTNNEQSTQYIVVQDKDILDKIVQQTVFYLSKTITRFGNPLFRNLAFMIDKHKAQSILNRIPDFKMIVHRYQNGEDLILHDAPVLFVLYSDKNIGFANVNAQLALQNAALMIQSLGLGSFYAGYVVAASINNRRIPKLLHLQENNQVQGCLALGYPKLKYKHWVDKEKPSIKWM